MSVPNPPTSLETLRPVRRGVFMFMAFIDAASQHFFFPFSVVMAPIDPSAHASAIG